MASELSRFIEQELEKKGIDPDDDKTKLLARESFRVESRTHGQQQRQTSKTTRNMCLGGCILVVVVLIIVVLSRTSAPEGQKVELTSRSSTEADGERTTDIVAEEVDENRVQTDGSADVVHTQSADQGVTADEVTEGDGSTDAEGSAEDEELNVAEETGPEKVGTEESGEVETKAVTQTEDPKAKKAVTGPGKSGKADEKTPDPAVPPKKHGNDTAEPVGVIPEDSAPANSTEPEPEPASLEVTNSTKSVEPDDLSSLEDASEQPGEEPTAPGPEPAPNGKSNGAPASASSSTPSTDELQNKPHKKSKPPGDGGRRLKLVLS